MAEKDKKIATAQILEREVRFQKGAFGKKQYTKYAIRVTYVCDAVEQVVNFWAR